MSRHVVAVRVVVVVVVVVVLTGGNTEGTHSSKSLCLKFVHVFCKFVSGLLLWFLDNLRFDDLRAE